MTDADHYCMGLVRDRDRDRYLCTLLAPVRYRSGLFALYAFNAEIAEIGTSVSEPLIGQMRLRWWLDNLESIYKETPPQHPVATAISSAISHNTLPRALFERMIEARERDLEDRAFDTLADLETYAEGVSSTLIQLSLACMGTKTADVRKTALHLGIAWTLTGILRAMPFHLSRGRILLPEETLDKHGFNRQSFLDHGYRGAPPNGMSDAVLELKTSALDHLQKARTAWPEGHRSCLSPVLLGTLAGGYLTELSKANNDPFQLPFTRPGPRVRDMLKLKWVSLLGRF